MCRGLMRRMDVVGVRVRNRRATRALNEFRPGMHYLLSLIAIGVALVELSRRLGVYTPRSVASTIHMLMRESYGAQPLVRSGIQSARCHRFCHA